MKRPLVGIESNANFLSHFQNKARITIFAIPNSRFSPVMWSKLKTITIQWIRPRTWDAIDDWYINNLSKNQVSAVFHSRVICRSVSPKFIELCMETPCLCPSEGHKHGGCKVTETSVIEFCYWNEKVLLLEIWHIEINASSSARNCLISKN